MDGLPQQSGSIYDGQITSCQYLLWTDYLSEVAVVMMDSLPQWHYL